MAKMGWKNLPSWVKGGMIGLVLCILVSIVFLFVQPLWLFVLYFFVINVVTFVFLGVFIGWIIDSIKRKDSSTMIGLKVGLALAIAIIFFMVYDCGSNFYSGGYALIECFFVRDLIGNNGWIAIVLALVISTLIGWLIGKIRKTH